MLTLASFACRGDPAHPKGSIADIRGAG